MYLIYLVLSLDQSPENPTEKQEITIPTNGKPADQIEITIVPVTTGEAPTISDLVVEACVKPKCKYKFTYKNVFDCCFLLTIQLINLI